MKTDLSGDWDSEGEGWNFSLHLKQERDKISGIHFAVAMNGNRIDNGEDGSISGVLSDKTVNVKFISGYSGKEGEANIKIINDNKIEWNIIQSSGENYLPEKAILTKSASR